MDAGADVSAPVDNPDAGAPNPGDAMLPGTMACAARGAVTMAPVDTDDAPAVAGPYRWRNVAIVAGGFISGVVFSPAQPDIVYARADIGGAYRWNAASKRWVQLLDWVPREQSNWAGVESIAPDPQNANIVYIAAGTYTASGSGVILRSSDRGKTFDQMTMNNIPMGGNNDGRSVGERLAVDPNHGNVLYFGSRTTGLWRSTDSGRTFGQVSLPGGLAVVDAGPANGMLSTPNGVGVSFVQFDPNSCGNAGDTVVYVGVAGPGPSLFRSVDGGATFEAVSGQPMTMLPSHGTISSTGFLFVTYGGGTGINGSGPNNVTTGAVWRFNTHDGTWKDVTPMPAVAGVTFGYAGVSVDAMHPDTVVVSTLDRWSVGDDIFRSANAGETWAPVGVPRAAHDSTAGPWVTFHQANPNYTGWMADVEIDPFDSNRVLHVTGQGIWATDNFGAAAPSWDFRSTGIEETAVLDLASPPDGPHLLSGVGDIGGFVHDDVDVSPAGGISINPVFSATDSVDFAGAAPAFVARVGRGSAGHGAYSINGGTTWQPFPTQLPIAANSAGSVAVSADGLAFVWDPPAVRAAGTTPASPGGPQVSHDSGRTWTPSTGIGAVRPVVADRVNPNKFYAYDNAMGGRLWVSSDQAATFAVGATGLGNNGRARATPGIEGDLWIVAGGNLFHSIDSGATTTPVATASAIYAMGFGMAPPGQTYPALYLGGTVNGVSGVYRSDNTGTSWVRIDDNQHRFGTGTVITGDPRIYGRVYIGTNGRGVFYGDATP
jgi:hypothetical protein